MVWPYVSLPLLPHCVRDEGGQEISFQTEHQNSVIVTISNNDPVPGVCTDPTGCKLWYVSANFTDELAISIKDLETMI